MQRIAAFFDFQKHRTSFSTEIMAGITTFMTMAYIIFLQPQIISGSFPHTPDQAYFNSILVATCLSAALATFIMGIYARYPLAQAPGMGENFFFVTMVSSLAAAGVTNAWQVGLGVIFISGVLFLLLSLLGVRALIMNVISPDMKSAMAAGIGIFIAFIGLRTAGLIMIPAGGVITMNHHFDSPDIMVFLFGLITTAVLHERRIRGAILWGILSTTAFAVIFRHSALLIGGGVEGLPESFAKSHLISSFHMSGSILSFSIPSLAPTFLKMDLWGALSVTTLPFILIFLFMDLFDTIGTLVGVSKQAGFLDENGTLPRARQALMSDAVATVAGAAMGTSTVTTFIESAAGVEQGGRTGFASVITASLFLLALFFSPLVGMIGSYPSITAPALVIVGAMMLRSVREIRWDDFSEAIPCFLVIIGIPLSYSIADGLALGFVTYPLIKLLSGRGKDVRWLMYVLAIVLVLYFILVRSGIVG